MLWPEEGLSGLTDMCRIVRELCEVVQQQGRDIRALETEVAALRAEAATVQEGKRAFISRLTSAAQDWDFDASLPEPEGAEEHEPEDEEHVSKKPRQG